MRKQRDAAMSVWLSLAAATALEVAVVSLTPPTASEHYGAAGRAWRWKVAVMGEDMALPRPKTALALAESIVERSGGAVQEAATLSTCARLLLIVAGNEDAVAATREACAAQIASFQTRPFDDWRRALDAAGDDIVQTSRAAPTVSDDERGRAVIEEGHAGYGEKDANGDYACGGSICSHACACDSAWPPR